MKKLCCWGVCLLALSSFSLYAKEDSSEIRNVYFPPVPEFWEQRIEGQSIVYSAPVAKQGEKSPTEIKITYTRRTLGRDAIAMIKEYGKSHQCSSERQLGVGFYMTSRKDYGTDAIFIGEPDNLYEVEISGIYTREAKELVSRYLSEIIKGKRTFLDRSIGDSLSK